MEVKPDKLKALFSHFFMHLFKVLPYSLLGAFLVDQVDQGAVLVMDFDVFIILPGHLNIDLVIPVHIDLRVPLEVRVLSPEVRY